MDRRGFLGAILAAAAAPAIVRADSLMRIIPNGVTLIRPQLDVDWWSGNIRELVQHDIISDEVVIRFDAIGRAASGALVQKHVFGRLPIEQDLSRAREPALAVLRGALRHEGLHPVAGMLTIPDGVRGRFV